MAKSSWQLAICQLNSANPEKYNLSFFEDARKSKQSKIACFSALPTFTLNYYQIMKRIQRNVKSDSFNYLIIYYSQYFCINHSLIRKGPLSLPRSEGGGLPLPHLALRPKSGSCVPHMQLYHYQKEKINIQKY